MKYFTTIARFSKLKSLLLSPKYFQNNTSQITYKHLYKCTSYVSFRTKINAKSQSLDEIIKSLLENLDKTETKEIITILWHATERNQQLNIDDLWQKVEPRIIKELQDLDTIDLALLAWLYGCSNQGSKEFWFQLEKVILKEMAEKKLRNTELAKIIQGFSMTNIPSATFWERVNKIILEVNDDFNAESISLIISGYGEYFLRSGFVDKDVLVSLKNCLLKNYNNLSSENIIMTLQGFSRMNYENNELWTKLSGFIFNNLESLNDKDIVICIQSFANVNVVGEELWRGLKSALYNILPSLNSNESSSIIWSFAKINHNDNKLWATFNDFVIEKYLEFDEKELIKVIWSFAYLKKNIFGD